jgi:DNA-binding CsgD family transcriptional regulator
VSAFIGRADELEALVEVASEASDGLSGAIVVGEPGSGKSRLLAEARERAAVPSSFAVAGYEPERHVPLAAAGGLLRPLTEVPNLGAQLEALLFQPNEAATLEPVRVFEAAHRAFRTLEPALLVVDDLHWVDELSLALCSYLIRAARESGQGLAVFAATRPGGPGIALADVIAPDRLRLLELTPLSREEGVQLVRAIDAGLHPSRAVELWKRAHGSPFWLEALVRGGAGETLAALLTVRLRGASSDAASVLALLAVAGRPVPSVDMATLAGGQAARSESALTELVERGLAVGAAGAVRLAHDLIREAALADLPEHSRRELHRRFAEWLERDAADDVRLLREALEHRRSAGMPTLDLALRLAGSPQRRLLGPEGLRLLAGTADECDPLDRDALVLNEAVAVLATELAEHEEGLARWSLVAGRAGGAARQASALLAASRAAYALERVAEAREYLNRSRELDAGDEILALEQRTHDAAIHLWLEQRTADGRALAEEAVGEAMRLAEEAGGSEALEPRARAAYLEALRLDYESAMQQGDYAALLKAAEARAAATQGFDLESYLRASLEVGVGLRQTGGVHEAIAQLRRVWDEAHRHVLPHLAVDAGYWLGLTLEQAGELAEAETIVLETSELAVRAGDVPRARHRVALVACHVALERSHPQDALRRLERETAEEPSEHQRIAFHEGLAAWLARLEGPGAAAAVREHLSNGWACAEAAGCPRCSAELLLFSAEALARIGAGLEAEKALERWSGLNYGADPLDGVIRMHAAALAKPEAETRVEPLEAALAVANRSGCGLQALWIRLDLGCALGEAGAARAVDELEAVAAEAHERGAETVRALAEQALRALGVRTWRRVHAGAPLTKREEEVARLVVGGATNREVAKTLFLSPKTIERHLSNVFRKVGARNRTELAARLRGDPAESGGNAR